MITVEFIDKAHEKDINIPNQPFKLYGRFLPSYSGGKWEYTVERFAPEKITETCFPDENYNYDEMAENSVFVGAYEDGRCIGVAVLCDAMFKYLYLSDLKVNSDYRGKGVGAMLIEKSKAAALERGYRGIYTIGQDTNLGACLFYIKNGFVIGGLDTRVYTGTSLEGTSDVLLYLD